jgi:hypothetical protein
MSKISITATIALSLASVMAIAANGAPKYQPFPDGYGYMDQAEIKALIGAVASGEHKKVRDHGWKLWAGIMQPAADGQWPIWYTWPNTKAAFAPSSGANLAASAAAGPGKSLIRLNAANGAGQPAKEPPIDPPPPSYPIPPDVIKAYPNPTKNCGTGTICDGAHFLFNGNILIPTESLSQQGFDWIRDSKVYEQSTLDAAHKADKKNLPAPPRYIVTKHMYWPVKAGAVSAIPVWHDYHDGTYLKYAGYETWPDLVGVDPSGQSVGKTVSVSYLYGVLQPSQTDPPPPWPTITASVQVYGLKDFYYHKVTQADWDSFDEADKAIINASSYWAYNQPFGPGDFLVTIAMHVNTREIPTWALQSAWWSDVPNSGMYAADRPKLPQAKGPWDHYLLVDGYGITDSSNPPMLPVATNPYIELVSHRIGTDCNNCHVRAGWPAAKYQGTVCPVLLEKLKPENPCFKDLTRSDFQWIIPDRAQ